MPDTVGLVDTVVLTEEDTEREVVPLTHAVGVPDVETLIVLLPDCEMLCVPEVHADAVAVPQEEAEALKLVLMEGVAECDAVPPLTHAVGVLDAEALTVADPDCDRVPVPEVQAVALAEGQPEAELVPLCDTESVPDRVGLALTVLEGDCDCEAACEGVPVPPVAHALAEALTEVLREGVRVPDAEVHTESEGVLELLCVAVGQPLPLRVTLALELEEVEAEGEAVGCGEGVCGAATHASNMRHSSRMTPDMVACY